MSSIPPGHTAFSWNACSQGLSGPPPGHTHYSWSAQMGSFAEARPLFLNSIITVGDSLAGLSHDEVCTPKPRTKVMQDMFKNADGGSVRPPAQLADGLRPLNSIIVSTDMEGLTHDEVCTPKPGKKMMQSLFTAAAAANAPPSPDVQHAPTERVYFADTYVFKHDCRMLGMQLVTDEKESAAAADPDNGTRTLFAIMLDSTIFHPQGGGQPSDKGTLSLAGQDWCFQVRHCSMSPTGVVRHCGVFSDTSSGATFPVNGAICAKVDEGLRRTHARIHSGGHLLDVAVQRIGLTGLKPTKGFHFASGAYVEYDGVVDASERTSAVDKLNKTVAQIIAEAIPTVVEMRDGKRNVNLAGLDCLCGGTHVKNTSEIGTLTISKVEKKGKVTRVKYSVTAPAGSGASV